MAHDEDLTLHTRDVHGKVPNLRLLGTRWRHTGNDKVYHIVDFSWLGATDEWAFVMTVPGTPNYPYVTRPLSHLDGDRDDGTRRYVRV